jgi:hypothetical protein
MIVENLPGSVTITALPTGLLPGTYYGTVVVTDADGEEGVISCVLTVTGAATSQTSVLPQFAFDGGWYSAMYFSNVTAAGASFPVNFVSDAGTPLNVPTGSLTQVSRRRTGRPSLRPLTVVAPR